MQPLLCSEDSSSHTPRQYNYEDITLFLLETGVRSCNFQYNLKWKQSECIYTQITTTGNIAIISLGCHLANVVKYAPSWTQGRKVLWIHEAERNKDRVSYTELHQDHQNGPGSQEQSWMCPELRRYKRPSYPRSTRSSGVRSRTRTGPAIREALESWPWRNAAQRPGAAARINISSSMFATDMPLQWKLYLWPVLESRDSQISAFLRRGGCGEQQSSHFRWEQPARKPTRGRSQIHG